MSPNNTFLSQPLAVFILVISASLFASNHIAARFAFDNDTGLLLAIIARGCVSLLLMLTIAWQRKASFYVPPHLRKWQLLLGLLIAGQSLALYSAITLIPVAMALLLVNTWPMMFIVSSWIMGKREPNIKTLFILVFILLGLFFVLDINPHIQMHEQQMLGIAFGILSAVLLTLTMWITQYQLADIPGSVRSSYTMLGVVLAMIILGVIGIVPDGLSLPDNSQGWTGLALLALFYGVAMTLLFVLAPKLDMSRNSPILNVEPVVSLGLAYVFLGQLLNGGQLIGGAMVVIGIISIGLMR